MRSSFKFCSMWSFLKVNSPDILSQCETNLYDSTGYGNFSVRGYSSLCLVFGAVSSNIDEVLSINWSANVFVFADFIIHHNYWLSYSGGTGRIFLPQMTLLRWLTFLLQIPDCDCHSLALLDLQSDLCITTTWGTEFPRSL